MKRLATMVRSLLSDPYVLTVVGSLCLIRGLDAMAAQARAVQEQAQVATQQWAQMYAAQQQANAVQAEANGFKAQPEPVADVTGKDA